LAAIFSYIALHSYDLVAVGAWGERLESFHPARGGRAAVPLVWGNIASITAATGGTTDFSSLRRFRHLRRGPGITFVLSDLLSDSDWQAGLRALRGAGQEITLVQVLSPEELNPAIRGDWKLQDAETGSEVEITLSPRLLRRYEEELEAHTQNIRDFCRRQGVNFLRFTSDMSVEDSVIRELYAARLVA
jgi:uncharacterized protein (DUF58 family)